MTISPIGDVDDVPRGLDVVVRTEHGHSSLWRWLALDPDTSGLLTGAGAPPEEGHQGVFEVINTVVANVLALSSLVVAIATWRAQRQADPPVVRLERNGVGVPVPDSSPDSIAAIAAALEIPEDDEPA